MNIGVLTHAIADNYGANLQALSTACYLRNMGYNPVFFRWSPYPSNTNSEQVRLHQTFLERHGFVVSDACVTDADFLSVIKDYNLRAIIVGSDCVFTYSPKVTLPDWQFPNPFWLPFLGDDNKIRCSVMSGSCGCSDLDKAPKDIRIKMKKSLEKLSFISVRDEYTRTSLRKILGKNRADKLDITPDPVFAFNQNVRPAADREDILSRFNLPQKYVVSSFYDVFRPKEAWMGELKRLLNEKGFALINLPMPQGGSVYPCDKSVELPLDPVDWYDIIRFSNGFIGNNMHPLIVAIHNAVPFFSINGHGKFFLRGRIQITRNTKEYELLRKLGLLQYHVGIRNLRSISASKLVDSLLAFDREYCKSCADVLQNDYNIMMEKIKGTF